MEWVSSIGSQNRTTGSSASKELWPGTVQDGSNCWV